MYSRKKRFVLLMRAVHKSAKKVDYAHRKSYSSITKANPQKEKTLVFANKKPFFERGGGLGRCSIESKVEITFIEFFPFLLLLLFFLFPKFC